MIYRTLNIILPAFTGVHVHTKEETYYTHGDLWDLKLMQKYVAVENISHDNNNNNYDNSILLDSRFTTNGIRKRRKIVQASNIPFLNRVPSAILSAVEQVVASHAEYFVGSTHSSWSEYVIYKRVEAKKKDARQNYDIWVKNLDILDVRQGKKS